MINEHILKKCVYKEKWVKDVCINCLSFSKFNTPRNDLNKCAVCGKDKQEEYIKKMKEGLK